MKPAKSPKLFFLFFVLFLFTFTACNKTPDSPQTGITEDADDTSNAGKIDDWAYDGPNEIYYESFGGPISGGSAGGGIIGPTSGAPSLLAPLDSAASLGGVSGKLGFSVGGAKDINNFRENVEAGYLPLPTDITYEGLFYDYYFDMDDRSGGSDRLSDDSADDRDDSESLDDRDSDDDRNSDDRLDSDACENLFCPSYTSAISKDPFSQDDDYYLAVGLNSNIEASDFERKKLNLVIVLDISGSMSSPFDSYYYDTTGNSYPTFWSEIPLLDDGLGDTDSDSFDPDFSKTKMQLANESIVGLLDHLNGDDRFGMVLFDDYAYLAKPLKSVAQTNIKKIKDHILDLTPQGGTYMEVGMEMGTELFEDPTGESAGDPDSTDLDLTDPAYENRIIFITDAMPNIGDTSEEGLLGMVEKNAKNNIYTTFIGVGVDFNTELIESITKVRGANYYSVHSASEFKKRMDEEFEFMVTPLVFDLQLNLDANGFDIEKVYGSPEADEATGEIMKVNTLFPSPTTDEGTKGGVILLKLDKTSTNPQLTLTVSYEDREGENFESSAKIEFKGKVSEFFENDGIRKAVLLARYADLMKDWIIDERKALNSGGPIGGPIEGPIGGPIIMPLVSYESGIIVPPPPIDWPPLLGQWERQSADLTVSGAYQKLFEHFKDHFEEEMEKIVDESLEQEVSVMDILIDFDEDDWPSDDDDEDEWLLDF